METHGPETAILCPGQGAQSVGMGLAWRNASKAAAATFAEADECLGDVLGAPLSEICFSGPADRLNQTDVAQPALYVCGVASYRGLMEQEGELAMTVAAGLSLGEYTALHLAGAFSFAEGLRLVATRGRLMQQAAERADSSMVALIGVEQNQAQAICDEAAAGDVLVIANLNAPGQIVLSGHTTACERAAEVAQRLELRATPLAVAGAFHSPLMQYAADGMAEALAAAEIAPLQVPVWSNVTAEPHDPENLELLRQRLVEQIVRPVRWAQTCHELAASGTIDVHELAPGNVLRGLMRRINRNVKVKSHDQP